jgi:colanic acid/amylovoran biosynthesis glycosyltransferase
VRLAVFTSQYPGRVNTFFARDVRGLLEAGIDIDVFPIYPEDASLWRQVPDILSERILPRARVHFGSLVPLSLRAGLARAVTGGWSDGTAAVRQALGVGPVPAAKTLYAWARALTWATADLPRFDHVLGYWGNYAATAAHLFCRMRGRGEPFSIFLHAGTDLYRDRIFLREKLLAARRVIVCSEFNKGFLEETYPDIGSDIGRKLLVHQHGLDLGELPYERGGRVSTRVVGVGGLEKKKGFDVLIRGCRALLDRGIKVELELVGDGPERERLTRLSRNLGIEGQVTFRGWLPFKDARDAIRRASVLVHPSAGLGDGAPNVIKEAMALGTPVVASAVAGIPWLLEDGRCGMLVPPGVPEALADAMTQVLNDGTLGESLAARARRSAEGRFDMWRNGRLLAGFLNEAPGTEAVG